MTTNARTNPPDGRARRTRLGRRSVCAALLLPLAGCMPDATLETDAQKVSYGKGFEVGRSMDPLADSLHLGALLLGLTAGLDGQEPQVSAEEVEAAAARLFGEPGAEDGAVGKEADAGAPASEGRQEENGQVSDSTERSSEG